MARGDLESIGGTGTTIDLPLKEVVRKAIDAVMTNPLAACEISDQNDNAIPAPPEWGVVAEEVVAEEVVAEEVVAEEVVAEEVVAEEARNAYEVVTMPFESVDPNGKTIKGVRYCRRESVDQPAQEKPSVEGNIKHIAPLIKAQREPVAAIETANNQVFVMPNGQILVFITSAEEDQRIIFEGVPGEVFILKEETKPTRFILVGPKEEEKGKRQLAFIGVGDENKPVRYVCKSADVFKLNLESLNIRVDLESDESIRDGLRLDLEFDIDLEITGANLRNEPSATKPSVETDEADRRAS